MSNSYIRLFDINLHDSRLTSKLDLSKDVCKYFLTKNFFAEYDCDLKSIDESILVIPKSMILGLPSLSSIIFPGFMSR